MTPEIFTRHIDMLVAATNPFRWNEKNSAAYWKALERHPDNIFVAACNRLLTSDDKMPSIPRLLQEMNYKAPVLEGCPECDKGRITFVVKHHNGQTYDRFAACDCEAGIAVAEKMCLMSRQSAIRNGLIPPGKDLEPYYWRNVRVKLANSLVTDDQTKPIPDAWDVETGSEASQEAFMGAIEKTRQGKGWNFGQDEKQFSKEPQI